MSKKHSFIQVIKTGPGTKIRDLGRLGYAKFGVPQSGPADLQAVEWINHLLKNHSEDAVLEITQPGLKLQFEAPTLICLAGAKTEIKLNWKTENPSGILNIPTQSLLEVGKFELGAILYLGISQGFQTPIRLGSRSFFKGITEQDFVRAGDQIPYFTFSEKNHSLSNSRVRWNWDYLKKERIRAYPGPEFDLLSEDQKLQFENQSFTISNLKNGMAVQLEELIPNHLGSIYTAPVFPGTVQLTHGGKLICLLQDAQVTGGYPRILQIHPEDLRIIAQKHPNQQIRFQLIST
ncbi:biotin-dependent carboxyltransferase family protein [Algoriphagus limi]|uniref:Biotin-dependent carboxyltransferase family protein n=1 Tax=Algoriphagus limi TaxID=2975273 RepID=A0ABT2G378_9BACT|nr:biotin-dependent carboxyltransferase family protein [Algoriphagus limi]MCS5489718.1 biotin-dependent carboxyltransferase family protein [Algoriphagus limi]